MSGAGHGPGGTVRSVTVEEDEAVPAGSGRGAGGPLPRLHRLHRAGGALSALVLALALSAALGALVVLVAVVWLLVGSFR